MNSPAAALPRIGLMLGDVTGIGPEIATKLLASGMTKALAEVIVFGDRRVLELGMRNAGVELPHTVYSRIDEVRFPRDDIPLVDLGNVDPAAFPQGASSDESGKLCGDTLKVMIDLALAGKLHGICFAPLNKGAMNRGGWKFNDEHQMFAKLTDHSGFFGEMNVIEQFSTFRVTSHVALREAVNLVTPERITAAINLANDSLRAAGCAAPRIGVAALNPHNGENGLFGDEEIRIIRPTVDKLRAEGVNCQGPISSDVIFLKALKNEFDGVVMMYHDQGQIATKLLGFNKGVTVTAGLKTVFTTPAHGTAYDIVGQGKADPGAMTSAFTLATKLAAARQLQKAAARTAAQLSTT
ncbi:MAG: 4-hydroxythreonine-4-phosphate dehydrogenase PdxA [Betaproteobacteria bacterium]|jgi:4-hydroxythreonine-4-phosphate dehydrogenase|nr:4-hydroxythreonine-4-phosphate dehydrogenase PdxA [Betaproteobacteria bacterium]